MLKCINSMLQDVTADGFIQQDDQSVNAMHGVEKNGRSDATPEDRMRSPLVDGPHQARNATSER
tara:strand:- start:211 stop:402 length:192 start_codon:yes stop_codon:yes gene_type:complete